MWSISKLPLTYVSAGVLHQLPLQCLEIMLEIHTSNAARHSAALQALTPLPITKLTLQLWDAFPAPVQRLWSAISVGLLSLGIIFGEQVGSNSNPLLHLPSCRRMVITWLGGWPFKEALQTVSWSVLTRHASNIRMDLGDLELEVLGAATEAPEHLQQPWQLVVVGAARLHGLPPSQLASGPYLLQNAVAIAAGWTVDTE